MHDQLEFAEVTFSLPVDYDHKATAFRPMSAAAPHMRAFHLAWLSLFWCYFSTFSAPPLLPIIRDALDLTSTDVANAGIASVSGTIFARLAMGPACDLLGPRISSAVFSLLTAPAVFAASAVSSAPGLVLLRFLAGVSLANFVANQYWMSSMFAPGVVGLANGVSSGWANVGSGAAQILMPLIYSLIVRLGVDSTLAWRAAFFVPATMQVMTAIAVLFLGQDLPDGDLAELQYLKGKPKEGPWQIVCRGLKNYRGWVLALTYGFCYGVELTMENIVAEYFYDRFDLGIQAAGIVAASFGLMNLISRPSGGLLSDVMAGRFGMRGRLWGLWAVQSLAGVFCVLFGWASSLRTSVTALVCFSLFVQAASGLTYGVVPFVSRRSLGVISGMTGSGGATGAVVTQLLFFSGAAGRYSTETGISLMGGTMLLCTLPVMLLYFPRWGGMFCGPSSDDFATDEDYYLPLK
ncbi:hypothetical protein Taro_044879 [Colocasia esculenta]|uniref:Major facilitator superfamily (MFS) profile domain-containing protein n=1 Tax=Colocasia esculenta TaxID=4460 RepID=A0A843WV45_COLES|nr:hypothetical protein [Colocasia esculenta]